MSVRSDPQGYYRVLGVRHTATAEEIRLAFRARAMESHPDQAAGAGNGDTFRLIREAYEVLRDPRRRMAYDASGLAAWTAAPAHAAAWADGFDERRQRGSGGDHAPHPAPDPALHPGLDPTREATPHPSDGVAPEPGQRPGPTNGARLDAGGASAGWSMPRQRRRRSTRADSSRLWPLITAGLALLLLVALGSLWSAHRQLDDRQGVVAELYDRLARMGAEQAELRSRYRSVAFLDLERALRLGHAGSGTAIAADTVRAVDRFDIAFADGGFDLDPTETQNLARALITIAGSIDRLPPDGEWLIVLEAQAARATFADQVAVEGWEAALLRLATVLDALLAHGLPGERVAIRFNAGFAPPAATDEATPTATEPSAFDRVTIQLLCCID